MANSGRPSYRLNLNRNPTRKWAEAKTVDYDGDDWGEDEYDDYNEPPPGPAHGGYQQQPGWGPGPGPGNTTQRSFTNPTLAASTGMTSSSVGRTSFDRDEERRHYPGGTFDHGQQPQPLEPASRGHVGVPPLHLQTQMPSARPQSSAQSGFRSNYQTDVHGVPYSAPVAHTGQRFYAGARQEHQESLGHNQFRPAHSDNFREPQSRMPSGPPVSTQQRSASPMTQPRQPDAAPVANATAENKPLPFVRPADIYKRFEEEREKERRSQESSRPSIDSTSGRAGDDSLSTDNVPLPKPASSQAGESDPNRRIKPTLDTVAERKSEYRMSSISGNDLSPDHTVQPASGTSTTLQEQQNPAILSKTGHSVETDQTDPGSASRTGYVHLPTSITQDTTPTSESFQRVLHQNLPLAARNASDGRQADTLNEDLPNFDQRFLPNVPAHTTDDQTTRPSDQVLASSAEPQPSGKLQHQPSLGYKSAVQQAFDAENDSILSPSNASDIAPRSDSASASEISPIISRRSVHGRDPSSDLLSRSRVIPEEPVSTHARNESTATVKASEAQVDSSVLPATTFQPGYRREKSPASTEEGAARRPLSVQIPNIPEAQQGVMSTVTSSNSTVQNPTPVTLPTSRYTPDASEQETPTQQDMYNDVAPTPASRTASEDWQEWQAQRQQVHAKHGIPDSDTASPAVSSISRSESPAKGTVKDIADRLESNSGRSSPANLTVPDNRAGNSSKVSQLRNEKFRPALPGGWMSDTTTTSSVDYVEGSVPLATPPVPTSLDRQESTDSIPTAVPPKNWQSSRPEPRNAAFAAAAAAGTAMVGAFSGPAFSRGSGRYSETTSEEGSDSETDAPKPPQGSDTRDFATASLNNPIASTATEIRTEKNPPKLNQQDNDANHRGTDGSIHFPAPLRTNKTGETKQPSPRLSMHPVASSQEHHDPDQLQQEIVKSLTPKSSNIDEPKAAEPDHAPASDDVALHSSRSVSIVSSDDDVLPQEYSSYWGEPQVKIVPNPQTSPNLAKVTPSETVRPPIPQTHPVQEDQIVSNRPQLLEHRYSWETGPEEQARPTGSGVSQSSRDLQTTKPFTPPPPPILSSSNVTSSPNSAISITNNQSISDLPQGSTVVAVNPPPVIQNGSLFPHERTNFRNILAFKDSTQRIRGFDENRQIFAQQTGLLENWLLSMRTPEHADVFQSNRLPPVQTTPGQESKLVSPPRSQPTTGTKQMQEDGKRLLAAAGKYGGKAGIAAKGLFARGKDKLRTASASDKVSITSRRVSSTFEGESSLAPSPQPTIQSTIQPTAQPTSAPQIPTPTLHTPPGEPSWGILSTKIDQMFLDRTSRPENDLTGKASLLVSTQHKPILVEDTTAHPTDGLDATRHERPPPSVLAALPGVENTAKTPSAPKLPDFGLATGSSKEAPLSGEHRDTGPLETNEHRSDSTTSSTATATIGQEKPWNLSVPRERRASSISDVSEISHAPDDKADVHPRNVSPTVEIQPKPQQIPSISTQSPTKEAEAQQEHGSYSEGTLPPYSSFRSGAVQQKPNHIAPGALIVPVADLSNVDLIDNSQAGSRPFSFVGSETLNHMQSSQRDSRILVSDTPQEYKQGGESSIQKSPQPNITEHPALREVGDGGDSHQAQLSNPLPSSRRSPQEMEQFRQRQPQPLPTQTDEGYRIPGPYVQEYRSPRSPRAKLNHEFPDQQHEATGGRMDMYSPVEPQYQGQPPIQSGYAPPAVQQRPDYNRNKSRTFGGLFRSRSKSQTRNQGRDSFTGPAYSSEHFADETKKRRGLFGFGNRDTSPVRQTNEAYGDMYGPDAGRGRKMSSTSGPRMQTDTKKKRSSGIGAFFSKSGGKDRESGRLERNSSAPLVYGPPQNYGNYSQPPPQQQQQQQQPLPPQQPLPNIAASDYRGHYPASSDPVSQFPQPPDTKSNSIGKTETAYQETQAYYATTDHHPDHGLADPNNRHDTTAAPQIYSSAQNNAVVAVTGPAYQRHHDIPHEQYSRPKSNSPPVPNTRANKDISHGQDRPYVPPTSPRPQVVPSPAESRPGMADRVKELHKRSRSPRLGRPPSDEFANHGYVDSTGSGLTTQRLAPDPATQLGMFNSKKISPQGGVPREPHEQESPWTIVLPTDTEDRKDEKLHGRGRSVEPIAAQSSKAATGADYIPTVTSHERDHHNAHGDTTSPTTAVDPTAKSLRSTTPSSHGNKQQRQSPDLNSQSQNKSNYIDQPTQKVDKAGAPTETATTIAVPPTISNAGVIPRPNPEAVPTNLDSQQTSSPTMGNEGTSLPSSKAARKLKRASIERTPDTAENTSPTTSRPLTVAERILGVQPTARDTVPEHRSTTPVPRSPAPPIESQPKVSTWPDANPSTAAVATSNVGGTTVTTTTMKSGSKLGKGSIKTNTYVIDTNNPLGSDSNRTNNHVNKHRDSTRVSASPSTAAPLQQTATKAEPVEQTTREPRRAGSSRQSQNYGKSFNAIELPGSKPDGYESEEEIVMSATAYPGQEWMPSLVPGASWDD